VVLVASVGRSWLFANVQVGLRGMKVESWAEKRIGGRRAGGLLICQLGTALDAKVHAHCVAKENLQRSGGQNDIVTRLNA
jgi:hypothetical protein